VAAAVVLTVPERLPARRRLRSTVAVAVAGAAALVAVQFAPLAARAADPPATGRAIAERLCSRCHAIDASGKSAHDKAPPFRSLGTRYPIRQLTEALAEGIVTGHPDMPEFTLEPRDIDALLTFIEGLQAAATRR
jgi:mono/diheme cytochrome c family protein